MKHGVNNHALDSVGLLNSPAEIKDSIRSLHQVVLDAEQLAQASTWRTGQDNRIVFVNKRTAEMLGYSPDQMLGENLLGFMAAEAKRKVSTVTVLNMEDTKINILWD